jgi:hypothetical protein
MAIIMQEKKHGNTGKQNALKGDVAKTSFIGFKVTPEKKAACVKKANGAALSKWVESLIDRELAK